MVLQAPISRHQQGDKTLAGKTTKRARTNIIHTGTHRDAAPRKEHFKYHALGGPNARAMHGTFGSGEEGNAYGAPLGSNPSTWSPSGRFSGGTENPSPTLGGKLFHKSPCWKRGNCVGGIVGGYSFCNDTHMGKKHCLG